MFQRPRLAGGSPAGRSAYSGNLSTSPTGSGSRLFRTPPMVDLPKRYDRALMRDMGTKSRETIYGSSIRASAERAREARKKADELACVAWIPDSVL
jgi:hypothetical protein